MKRILIGIILLCSMLVLTACDNVPIKQGVIDVIYENVHYEGTSLIVEVKITNGTDEDVDVGYVDFWLEFPDNVDTTTLGITEFCGAGFPIDEIIKSQGYGSYELEFTNEYIFASEADLEGLGIAIDDLILFFNIQ